MPAYNFQRQFVDKVRSGVKEQTIRRRRKNPTKAGDLLYLYTGMRTKQCELIGKYLCVGVRRVQINMRPPQVWVNGLRLADEYLAKFVTWDGFDNAEEFFKFFERYPREVLENELEVIYWRPYAA